MNEIILFLVILIAIGLPFGEILKKNFDKKAKAKMENAKIEGEKKLKADEISEFDKNLIRLEKLGKLYKEGIITKEEFEEKRNKFNL